MKCSINNRDSPFLSTYESYDHPRLTSSSPFLTIFLTSYKSATSWSIFFTSYKSAIISPHGPGKFTICHHELHQLTIYSRAISQREMAIYSSSLIPWGRPPSPFAHRPSVTRRIHRTVDPEDGPETAGCRSPSAGSKRPARTRTRTIRSIRPARRRSCSWWLLKQNWGLWITYNN